MHHKAYFALAAVFLVIAVIVPTILFFLQAQNDLVIIKNPAGMYTGNATSNTPTSQVQQSHTNTLIIVAVIEVVFGFLSVLFMYLGYKHVHPTH